MTMSPREEAILPGDSTQIEMEGLITAERKAMIRENILGNDGTLPSSFVQGRDGKDHDLI